MHTIIYPVLYHINYTKLLHLEVAGSWRRDEPRGRIAIASVMKTSRPATRIQGLLAPSPAIPAPRNQTLRHLTSALVQDDLYYHTHSLSRFDSTIQFNLYFYFFYPSATSNLPQRRKRRRARRLPLCKGARSIELAKRIKYWVEDVNEWDLSKL